MKGTWETYDPRSKSQIDPFVMIKSRFKDFFLPQVTVSDIFIQVSRRGSQPLGDSRVWLSLSFIIPHYSQIGHFRGKLIIGVFVLNRKRFMHVVSLWPRELFLYCAFLHLPRLRLRLEWVRFFGSVKIWQLDNSVKIAVQEPLQQHICTFAPGPWISSIACLELYYRLLCFLTNIEDIGSLRINGEFVTMRKIKFCGEE